MCQGCISNCLDVLCSSIASMREVFNMMLTFNNGGTIVALTGSVVEWNNICGGGIIASAATNTNFATLSVATQIAGVCQVGCGCHSLADGVLGVFTASDPSGFGITEITLNCNGVKLWC